MENQSNSLNERSRFKCAGIPIGGTLGAAVGAYLPFYLQSNPAPEFVGYFATSGFVGGMICGGVVEHYLNKILQRRNIIQRNQPSQIEKIGDENGTR